MFGYLECPKTYFQSKVCSCRKLKNTKKYENGNKNNQ